MAALVAQLRARREQLGWPQSAVDDRLGVTDGLTAKWESGQRRPSPYMTWLWAATLGGEFGLAFGPAPPAPQRIRHKVERRVKRGVGRAVPARSCHDPVRADAPANPYEP